MNGLEFGVLGHRLRHEHGFDVRTFSYPTHAAATRRRSAATLAEYRRALGGGRRVHFVGHSLGGAIVYRTLAECGAGRFGGNAVLLGSPLNGSRAARGASRWPMLRPLLGPHVLERAGRAARPSLARAPTRSASIAGTLRMGTGQFFAHFDEDNDGTVARERDAHPGLADHLVLPHSHMGMLLAADVAAQIAYFLRKAASGNRPACWGACYRGSSCRRRNSSSRAARGVRSSGFAAVSSASTAASRGSCCGTRSSCCCGAAGRVAWSRRSRSPRYRRASWMTVPGTPASRATCSP